MKTIRAEASLVPFAKQIEDVVMTTPVVDIRTHLYDPAFKGLLALGHTTTCLVYHYLVAESFRYLDSALRANSTRSPRPRRPSSFGTRSLSSTRPCRRPAAAS